ncbi:hypothetical protein PENTCL1PPCAC_22663, partial [Pristionchus entomophagus]
CETAFSELSFSFRCLDSPIVSFILLTDLSMLKVESVGDSLPRLQASGNSSNQLLDKGKDEEKIWTRILSEVSAKSSSGQQSSVIILGDHKCGNHSLISKLEKDKAESATKGASALEYHTLHVQADIRDGSYAYQLGTAGALGPAESVTLPVWLLDGDETFAPLLLHALPSSAPSRAVVLLTAALDNPGMMHSLRRWATVLAGQVTAKYDKTALNEAKSLQERFWQEYVEPAESSMSASIMQGMDDPMVVPLEQGVLSENCGASLIVVITKSDIAPLMATAQWEKLVVQIRRFCLSYGAALFCVSSKKGHNTQQLYKYIVHRAFGTAFTSSAQMIERECLFVPAGWDSQKKIDIMKESVGDVETLEPTREKPPVKDCLVEAEEEQSFLARISSIEVATPLTKKQAVDESAAPDNNTALASFFSNLLRPQAGKTPSAAAATPLDPAAQLDRIRSSATTSTKPDSTA